jgi:hypothetical protein
MGHFVIPSGMEFCIMPIGPDQKELDQMRAAVEELFPDHCNLLTATSTADSQGGFTEAWGTLTRNVPCRLDQMSGSERLTDGSLRAFTSLELALPWDTTIDESYRVEIGGSTYLVVDAYSEQSWQVERSVQVERQS